MQKNTNVLIIKKCLKQQMKKQKKSFQDLAAHLNCSLITAKRVLNKEELSVSRLNSILSWLDLQFSDLSILIEQQKVQNVVRYTEKQEEFFYKNPSHFAIFLDLYNFENLDVLFKRYKLSKKEFSKLLNQLDNLELIKRGTEFNLKLIHSSPPEFIKKGLLQKKFYKNVIELSSKVFTENAEKILFSKEDPEEPGSYTFIGLDLHKNSYIEISKEVKKFYERIQFQSKQDSLLYNKNDLKTYVFALGYMCTEGTSASEDFIKNAFAGHPNNDSDILSTGI